MTRMEWLKISPELAGKIIDITYRDNWHGRNKTLLNRNVNSVSYGYLYLDDLIYWSKRLSYRAIIRIKILEDGTTFNA